MSQSSSYTAEHEDHGDLVSDFTEYFKKFKRENEIISQETIHLIEYNLKKGNIEGLHSVISNALKNIDNAPISIAVTGESGAGKSSLINALREVGHEDKSAAEVGVVETTMERTPYKHPKVKTLTLWDLPGIGTMNFPPKDYLEKVKFQEYDFFIIVSATRFTKLELDLAKAIRIMGKNYYFVRTKVDFDLDNEKCKPHTFDRERILQMIRSYCEKTFIQNNMDAPQIFLISNISLSDYDFPVLMDTLIKDLPAQKRHNFMLSLPNITEAAIDRKRKSMQNYIWLEASMSAIMAVLPMVGILRDDVEKLKVNLNHYQVTFGVDAESLEFIAKDFQVPVEQLKKIIKSPYLLETKKEETSEEMLMKYLETFMSATGGPLSSAIHFRKTYYLQLLFLDTVTEDAKVLCRRSFKEINREHSNSWNMAGQAQKTTCPEALVLLLSIAMVVVFMVTTSIKICGLYETNPSQGRITDP
ncbi:interferon-inducible GTPase 1-like isoform X2 [Mesocricetus auratus]|nr:interferon-inducible GTPase 1-like isoform X2 [Mesocricetus auratus]XP_040597709.1 interferon-inducible GTPase 1-like isoform X2 [Mesocricetus auratus]XP_040597710.1 interferon-inducible GTPase 1-like isoform X2 [Mesocricetus auratus]